MFVGDKFWNRVASVILFGFVASLGASWSASAADEEGSQTEEVAFVDLAAEMIGGEFVRRLNSDGRVTFRNPEGTVTFVAQTTIEPFAYGYETHIFKVDLVRPGDRQQFIWRRVRRTSSNTNNLFDSLSSLTTVIGGETIVTALGSSDAYFRPYAHLEERARRELVLLSSALIKEEFPPSPFNATTRSSMAGVDPLSCIRAALEVAACVAAYPAAGAIAAAICVVAAAEVARCATEGITSLPGAVDGYKSRVADANKKRRDCCLECMGPVFNRGVDLWDQCRRDGGGSPAGVSDSGNDCNPSKSPFPRPDEAGGQCLASVVVKVGCCKEGRMMPGWPKKATDEDFGQQPCMKKCPQAGLLDPLWSAPKTEAF